MPRIDSPFSGPTSIVIACAAAALSIAACSAGSDDPADADGSRVAAGAGAGSAGDGDDGELAVGAGGSSNPSGGSGGACAAIHAKAENKLQPADILFVVDNSDSMNEECAWVQESLNGFASTIVAANIDAHVMLLSSDSGGDNGICVPAPLGSGACPEDDLLPGYLHLKQRVGSHDGLEKLLDRFPDYAQIFRPGASKHVVMVTDDESDLEASSFDQQFKGLLQGVDPSAAAYRFHAIYAPVDGDDDNDKCVDDPGYDECCGLSEGEGEQYEDLVSMTGGTQGNLCLQDFGPVFAAISAQVVSSSGLACEWEIPPPPNGEDLDPDEVNVELTPSSGPAEELGHVASAADCAGVALGWYYDDPAAPTKVIVCPDTCAVFQADPAAQVSLAFGCGTKPAQPK